MNGPVDKLYITKGIERLVFFSDAVFAIAITLLALDIKLPDDVNVSSNTSLIHALRNLFPQVLAFVLSFLIIGVLWASHVRKYRALKTYDSTFVMLNIIFLLCIAFMPFPTSLISGSPTVVSVTLYASILVIVGIISALNWAYAVKRGFIFEEYAKQNDTREFRGPVLMSLVFLVSIVIAFVNPTYAMWSWLLLIPAVAYFR